MLLMVVKLYPYRGIQVRRHKVKLKQKFFAIPIIGLCLVMGGPLHAEGTPGTMGMDMHTFADCDLDGDGTIIKEEFMKARSERIAKRAQEGHQMKNLSEAPSFEDIDTNEDDGISPEEFSAHQAKQMEKHKNR
jgi:hypothetical protein